MKSAVLNYLNQAAMMKKEVNPNDVAASFQQAVIDVLVDRAMTAARDLHQDKLVLAGGVAANGALREALAAAMPKKEKLNFIIPRRFSAQTMQL